MAVISEELAYQEIEKSLLTIQPFDNSTSLLWWATRQASVDGLYLEFGVWVGRTIKLISLSTTKTVYGFDTFRGIDQDWNSTNLMEFDMGGVPPTNMPSNVEFVVGLFADTLPKFVEEHDYPVSFLHIDSDIYESVRTALFGLSKNIVPETIIVFDEYSNYPKWVEHEYRAFREFVEEFNVTYEYIGCVPKSYAMAIKIVSIGGKNG